MANTDFDLDAIYRQYAPMVLRRCRAIVKDEAIAMDLMQNVFLQVARKRESLSMEYPSSLLYRIATNLSLNYIRDNKRLVREYAGSGDNDESLIARLATIESGEKKSLAGMLLERLFGMAPDSTRTIAMLHYHDGFTLEETAQEVGMSVSGVRKRLRQLRSLLQDMEGSYVDYQN